MIRILETTYTIEATRHEFDVLKKVLVIAAASDDIQDALEAWEHRILQEMCSALAMQPERNEPS